MRQKIFRVIKILLLSLVSAAVWAGSAWGAETTPLIISEFMANKGSGLTTTPVPAQPQVQAVETEQVSPDWIEIYNGTAQPVNLAGWYLTDNKNNLTKWRFPAIIINPGQYLVVFASEKDQKYYPNNYPYFDGTYYHTNFQLDRDGEYLALVRPDGVTVAHEYAPKYPPQQGLVSYGYCSNSDIYGYFINPTPAAENDTVCITEVVADTKFSTDRGFYDAPFSVAITTQTTGATIHYTTDGSMPTETHGQLYSGPILISTTTCLRAMAFKNGLLPSDVDTQTYIFLDDVIQQTGAGFPNTWGHLGADYEMDPVVVSAYSSTIKDDLKSIPTMSLVMNMDDWFNGSTDWRFGGIYANPDWEDMYDEQAERAVSVELFDPNDDLGQFQLNAVVRIAGGTSTSGWKSDKLSMRLKFQEPYGPTKLDFSLFGENAADNFDTLVLDARLNNAWNYGNNDSQRRRAQYTRDQFTSDIQNAMAGFAHHGLHVHLYLNGLYWGLYNLHERPDESFAASYFGGNKKDYDVLKHNEGIVVNGSSTNYREMFDIAKAGLSSNSRYQLIQQYLDVPNFIDYMITNFYYGNTDWAHQNWYATRSRVDPNGRWRYHCWDAEKGMQGLNDDVTNKDNGYGSPTYLHQRLTANADYRMLFSDHVHRYFFNDGLLTVDNATALYQYRLDEVDRAVVGESARWGDNRIEQGGIRYTRDEHWVAQRNWLLNTYFSRRTNIVLNQLEAQGLYPNINAPVFQINGSYQHGGRISKNDVFSMTATTGTIWYTLDGSDPRLPGTSATVSDISPDAIRYIGPVTLTKSTHVKSRVLNGNTWSALNEATFVVGSVADNLRVTELMYNPAAPPAGDSTDNDEFEFIELKNIGDETLDLANVSFTEGIIFDFSGSDITGLAGGDFVLVVKNKTAFESRYGIGLSGKIAGEYSGKLANEGEKITLIDLWNGTIVQFEYSDSNGWPQSADGAGHSLVPLTSAILDEPDGSLNDGGNWRASTHIGGSPGQDDP